MQSCCFSAKHCLREFLLYVLCTLILLSVFNIMLIIKDENNFIKHTFCTHLIRKTNESFEISTEVSFYCIGYLLYKIVDALTKKCIEIRETRYIHIKDTYFKYLYHRCCPTMFISYTSKVA